MHIVILRAGTLVFYVYSQFIDQILFNAAIITFFLLYEKLHPQGDEVFGHRA